LRQVVMANLAVRENEHLPVEAQWLWNHAHSDRA